MNIITVFVRTYTVLHIINVIQANEIGDLNLIQ